MLIVNVCECLNDTIVNNFLLAICFHHLFEYLIVGFHMISSKSHFSEMTTDVISESGHFLMTLMNSQHQLLPQ